MAVTISVPEDTVGDVIGDLNSRRGRRRDGAKRIHHRDQGRAADGGTARLRAGSALDHRRQGDYTMEFLRYEEFPPLVSKVLARRQANRARLGAHLAGVVGCVLR